MKQRRRHLALGLSLVAAIAVTVSPDALSAKATAASPIPTPKSVIGWDPCADYKLATYEQVADYYRKLDAASDRMQLMEIGKTAEGRPQLMAVISSEKNLRQKDLKHYKQISAQLSHAKGLSDQKAHELAQEGKAIAWVDFGIHSTEVASSQDAPSFAYKLVTDESAETKNIRDNVITLVVPNMNPDGTTAVAEWYRKTLGTPYQDSTYPALYQKYAGHDDNRDWFMYNLPETRNVGNQLYHEWFPQLIHNTHQTAVFPARIFVPPFKDPLNPSIPAKVTRGVNLVGSAMTERLDREGKVGAISRQQYDQWWNGGMRSVPQFHNMIGLLTETAHASATPANYDPKTFPATFPDGTSTSLPSAFYPSPYKGGEWHLRDSCGYISTASMAMLDIASKDRENWLYGSYQMGQDAIHAGGDDTYVIPADQADFPTAVKMVNSLRWAGIEVERADAAFTLGGKSYPANSYVIRAAQAYRPYVEDLMNPQVYPDRREFPGGPPERPYDIAGWTLPMQMGVQVDKHTEPLSADTRQVTWATPPAGQVASAPKYAYALDPRVDDSATAVNQLLGAGESIARSSTGVTTRDGKLPAGTFLVTPRDGTARSLKQLAKSLGLTVAAVDKAPQKSTPLAAPRIGVYQASGGNADEGWTRYTLEQFKFDYTTLRDADVRKGNLRDSYDAIVLPDATYASMRDGKKPGTLPEEYTGGMTPAGVANLKAFVEAGGQLITFNKASQLPIQAFGLPVKDVTSGLTSSQYFVPGSILRSEVDNTDPVAYGMPAEASVFANNGPAFQVAAGTPGVKTVAGYPASGLLKSGYLLGEDVLANRSSVVTADVGKGRIVMTGFQPQYRSQSHGTFKLIFNALYASSMR